MILTRISHTDLRSELREGVVTFAFKKLDGSLRTAVGTTNLSLVPAEQRPTGRRSSSPNSVTFFDLEKRQWRSLSLTAEVFKA